MTAPHRIDTPAFVFALIGGPLMVTAMTCILIIPIGALIVGFIPYLVFGTPVAVMLLRRGPPTYRAFAGAGAIVAGLLGLGVLLVSAHDASGRVHDWSGWDFATLLIIPVFGAAWACGFVSIYRSATGARAVESAAPRPINRRAFAMALIGGPLVVTVLTFWLVYPMSAFMIGIVPFALIGIPLFTALLRRGPAQYDRFALAAGLVGLVPGLAITAVRFLMPGGQEAMPTLWEWLLPFAIPPLTAFVWACAFVAIYRALTLPKPANPQEMNP